MPGPATCESLRARHDAIISQYIENDHLVKDIQQQALQELIPLLQQEFDATASPLPNSDEIIAAAKTFLQDQGESSRSRASMARMAAQFSWLLPSHRLSIQSSSALQPLSSAQTLARYLDLQVLPRINVPVLVARLDRPFVPQRPSLLLSPRFT